MSAPSQILSPCLLDPRQRECPTSWICHNCKPSLVEVNSRHPGGARSAGEKRADHPLRASCHAWASLQPTQELGLSSSACACIPTSSAQMGIIKLCVSPSSSFICSSAHTKRWTIACDAKNAPKILLVMSASSERAPGVPQNPVQARDRKLKLHARKKIGEFCIKLTGCTLGKNAVG